MARGQCLFFYEMRTYKRSYCSYLGGAQRKKIKTINLFYAIHYNVKKYLKPCVKNPENE